MADILYLVDRLEDLLSNGYRIPLTSYTVVDEDTLLDLIDQMRIAIPNEIRQAQRVVQERDRVLAQAREEADRVLAQAHEEAGRILSEQELVRATQARAQSLMAMAQEEAEEVRAGADDYALGVLEDLGNELERITNTVQNGLQSLHTRRASRKPPAPLATTSPEPEDEEDSTLTFDDSRPMGRKAG